MYIKKFVILFLFWWAIVFPDLFFSNEEIFQIKNENISYKIWISDFVKDF